MKISAMRRALVLANVLNLLVALYFIIIAIVALVQLRWYHQLTITVNVRYLLTSITSYFAFFILIFAGLLLIAIFVTHTFSLAPAGNGSQTVSRPDGATQARRLLVLRARVSDQHKMHEQQFEPEQRQQQESRQATNSNKLTTGSQPQGHDFGRESEESASVCCSIIVHLLATTSLVIILIIWLINTGDLVRDSISSQLEAAFHRYQFANRTNHYTIAIDGMQEVNRCCGSIDYNDFPHHRMSGLSSGLYPGSCCGKSVFGVDVRPICRPEEIYREKRTIGCTVVLANYYDLISILIVPVALVSMFVNITIIALITIIKGNDTTSASNQQLAIQGLDSLAAGASDHHMGVTNNQLSGPTGRHFNEMHTRAVSAAGSDVSPKDQTTKPAEQQTRRLQ